MSASSLFATKYGKSNGTTGGKASTNFLKSVQAGTIKPVTPPVAQTPPPVTPPKKTGIIEGIKSAALAFEEKTMRQPNPKTAAVTKAVVSDIGKGVSEFGKVFAKEATPAFEASKQLVQGKINYQTANLMVTTPVIYDKITVLENKQKVGYSESRQKEIDRLNGLISDAGDFKKVGQRILESQKLQESRTVRGVVSGTMGTTASFLDSMSWIKYKMGENGESYAQGANKLEEWSQAISPEVPNFSDQVAQGLGSALLFYLPGLGVMKATGVIEAVSPKLALLFGNSASTALEAASEAGSVYDEGLKQGKSKEEASKAADKVFWLNAALIGITQYFGIFGDNKTLVKRMLASASSEGVQEYSQQVISNVNTGKPWFEGTVMSGIIGMLMGGGMSTFGAEGETNIPPVKTEETVTTEVPPAAPTAPAVVEQVEEPVVERKSTILPKDSLTKLIQKAVADNNLPFLAKMQEQVKGNKTATELLTRTINEGQAVKQIKTIGKETPVFRGAKIQKIGATRANGITGGISLSEDVNVAQRFADKVKGTVKNYFILPTARIINHSVLEGMNPAEIKTFLKENNIDVVRFDIKKGQLGESELRVINPAVLKVSSAVSKKTKPVKTTTVTREAEKAPEKVKLEPKAVKRVLEHGKKAVLAKTTGKVTPNFYRKNKVGLYRDLLKVENSERLLTNAETLAVVRKYFATDEVGVEFLENINTLDGEVAWGKYAKEVISFVNEPKTAKVPTHESVHAYLDLFTTPAQKQFYIERKLADLRKGMTKSEINKEIRLTQEQTKDSTGRMVPIDRAARIYGEEQIADDFIKYVTKQEKTVLQRFFDKVIRFAKKFTDPNSVDNLYQDIIDKRRETSTKIEKERRDYFKIQEDKFAVTTRTLERMRRELVKDTVSKQTIESYARREGVTKADLEVFNATLAEFKGDKINVANFITSLQAKIIPVSLIRSQAYADYGTSHLEDLNRTEEDKARGGQLLEKLFVNNNFVETHIWDTPYKHGEVGHFIRVFETKKVDYEIKEVEDPSNGKPVYIVVEKGVVLNQDNVERYVATISNTMEGAKAYIKAQKEKTGSQASGLLGHSRIGTTKTPEAVQKNYETKIEQLQEELDVDIKRQKINKAFLSFWNKNSRVITDRLNTAADALEKTLLKKSPGSNFKGFEISYLLDTFEGTKDSNWEEKSKVRTDFVKGILKGLDSPTIPERFAEDLTELMIQTRKFSQVRVLKIVRQATDLSFKSRMAKEARQRIAQLKKDAVLARQRTIDVPAVRHVLEFQADPFQSRYEVKSAYIRARDEVLRLEKQNKKTPATLPEEKAAEERALNNAKAELLKVEKERTLLEKQFYAVGSKFHERIIKEEIRLAAQDLLVGEVNEAKLRIPTPVTSAFIEGFINTRDYKILNGSLVKEGIEQKDLLAEQMKAEMPDKPIPPYDNLSEGERVILPPEDITLNNYDHISVDGELFEVSDRAGETRAIFITPMSEDYHLNQYENINEDDELNPGNSFQYADGNEYTVLSNNGSVVEAAKGDRVRDINVQQEIDEDVESQMDEVRYEIKNLISKYGEIDTAEKAQAILDLVGKEPAPTLIPGTGKEKLEDFDFFETRTVLEAMAEDTSGGTIDPSDFEEKAYESLGETQSDYIGDENYWTDMGYEKAVFYNDGADVLVVEEGGTVETFDAPDSEYNIYPDEVFSAEDVESMEKKALSLSGKSTEEYDAQMTVYDMKVVEIEKKFEKLRKENEGKVPPASIDDNGSYLFDTTALSQDEYRTIYGYYESKIVPFFKKFRKDAQLITDENGQQWWETTVTPVDKQPVEVYSRKSPYETLLAAANKILREQKLTKKQVAATVLNPVQVEGKRRASKAFSRMVDQLTDEYAGDPFYDQMTIANDVANAMEFVKQNPERAIDIARGLELPPLDITDTAISIAAADVALEKGDAGLWADLELSRSRRQTRRGQEIVSERGRIADNSPEYFLQQVAKEREAIALSKKGWVYEAKAKKKGLSFGQLIKDEVEVAKKKVDKQTVDKLENAQSILDKLTCK